MLAWFYRKSKQVTYCHSWICEKIIKKGDMYIGRNTYGGIMAYCPDCCPDEDFKKKIHDVVSLEKTGKSLHSITDLIEIPKYCNKCDKVKFLDVADKWIEAKCTISQPERNMLIRIIEDIHDNVPIPNRCPLKGFA